MIICKECLGCNMLENPKFKGLKYCYYALVEDKKEQKPSEKKPTAIKANQWKQVRIN